MFSDRSRSRWDDPGISGSRSERRGSALGSDSAERLALLQLVKAKERRLFSRPANDLGLTINREREREGKRKRERGGEKETE